MDDEGYKRYIMGSKQKRVPAKPTSGAIIAFPGDLGRIIEAMQARQDEREETLWMLRLDTGDDKEHRESHASERGVACRFCRLEVYTEEQEKAQAEGDAEEKRKSDFLGSLIDVDISPCCATCRHVDDYAPYGEEPEYSCTLHCVVDLGGAGYGIRCEDWEASE